MSMYLGIFLTVSIILHHTSADNDFCNNSYTNENGIHCLPCEPGFTAIDDCTDNLTRAKCDECSYGTFQQECAIYDNNRTSSCKNCSLCSVYKENCTIYHDAICEPLYDVQNRSDTDDNHLLPWLVSLAIVCGLFLSLLSCLVIHRIRRRKRTTRQYTGRRSMDVYEGIPKMLHKRSVNQTQLHVSKRRISGQISGDILSECFVEDAVKQSKVNDSTSNSSLGDKTTEHDVDFGKEITNAVMENDVKQIAVVHPHSKQINNDCKEVGQLHDETQHTRENLQLFGDQDIAQERQEKNENDDNQSCTNAGNISLSLKKLDEGTPASEVNWPKVFLILARSLPPAKWEFFAIHLLSNCQNMLRNVHDTVTEIKVEVHNQYTDGLVNQAYVKVLYRWLDNLGKAATFEQIEDAVAEITDAEETIKLVRSIKGNPPKKLVTPMMKRSLTSGTEDFTLASMYSNSEHYVMALHNDDEEPGTSTSRRDVFISSSQKLSYKPAHCLYCASYSSKEIATLQENKATIPYNKFCIAPNNNFDEKCSVQQNQSRKRKMTQSTDQQYKRVTTAMNIIEKAKQNILNKEQIRQYDYELYMDFVIDLISETCRVFRKAVLSLTIKGFFESKEINIDGDETVFIVRGDTDIYLKKDVYEDLAVYGNNARPKLLSYLKAKNGEYDNTASEKFLFLTFKGNPVLEEMENTDNTSITSVDESQMDSEQQSSIAGEMTPSRGMCTEIKESENNLDNSTSSCSKETISKHTDPINGDVCNSGVSREEELLGATSSKVNEPENEASINNPKRDNRVINEREETKEQNTDILDVDIEKELEDISASFFPTGDETYTIKNTDNIPEMLERFRAEDLENSAKD